MCRQRAATADWSTEVLVTRESWRTGNWMKIAGAASGSLEACVNDEVLYDVVVGCVVVVAVSGDDGSSTKRLEGEFSEMLAPERSSESWSEADRSAISVRLRCCC